MFWSAALVAALAVARCDGEAVDLVPARGGGGPAGRRRGGHGLRRRRHRHRLRVGGAQHPQPRPWRPRHGPRRHRPAARRPARVPRPHGDPHVRRHRARHGLGLPARRSPGAEAGPARRRRRRRCDRAHGRRRRPRRGVRPEGPGRRDPWHRRWHLGGARRRRRPRGRGARRRGPLPHVRREHADELVRVAGSLAAHRGPEPRRRRQPGGAGGRCRRGDVPGRGDRRRRRPQLHRRTSRPPGRGRHGAAAATGPRRAPVHAGRGRPTCSPRGSSAW